MGSFEDFFFNHFYFEIWDSILKKFLFIILIFKFEIEILFSWTSFEIFFIFLPSKFENFSTSSSSLSLLAPLPLFTSFFLLHFLHFYTISCLENHFSRLPNLIFSISQNIFSNPWVLDHLCETHFLKFIFFWNSSLHFHGISSWTNFSYFQWEEISSIPRMERWRGAPSRPKHPCSTLIQKGFQVSLFFCFFCW